MKKLSLTFSTLSSNKLGTVTGGGNWGINSNGTLGYSPGGGLLSIGVDGKVGISLFKF